VAPGLDHRQPGNRDDGDGHVRGGSTAASAAAARRRGVPACAHDRIGDDDLHPERLDRRLPAPVAHVQDERPRDLGITPGDPSR
jgi:hypothetical protein